MSSHDGGERDPAPISPETHVGLVFSTIGLDGTWSLTIILLHPHTQAPVDAQASILPEFDDILFLVHLSHDVDESLATIGSWGDPSPLQSTDDDQSTSWLLSSPADSTVSRDVAAALELWDRLAVHDESSTANDIINDSIDDSRNESIDDGRNGGRNDRSNDASGVPLPNPAPPDRFSILRRFLSDDGPYEPLAVRLLQQSPPPSLQQAPSPSPTISPSPHAHGSQGPSSSSPALPSSSRSHSSALATSSGSHEARQSGSSPGPSPLPLKRKRPSEAIVDGDENGIHPEGGEPVHVGLLEVNDDVMDSEEWYQ